MEFITVDSDCADEEEDIVHQELVRERDRELSEIIKKRHLAKVKEDEDRFPKIKHTDRSLIEYLSDQKCCVPRDHQAWYDSFKTDVINHFENGVEDFVIKMKMIKDAVAFRDFLVSRHMEIVSEPKTKEKERIHKGLVEFDKQIVAALRKMTSIPCDEEIISTTAQNVFEDTSERALKRIASKISANYVLEQLQATDLYAFTVMREKRDTSPPRECLSAISMAQLNEQFQSLFVHEHVTIVEKDKDDNFLDMFSAGISDDDEEPSEECIYNDEITKSSDYVLDLKTEWVEPVYICKKEEEGAEEFNIDEGEDFILPYEYKALSDQLDRTGTHFGQNPPEYMRRDWELKRFENKRKKQSRVKFEKYDSPQNKMRIFVKPNGNFYKSDDTPVSDYVDLSLRDGTLVLKDVEFPLTSIATKASVFRSRRRKDNFDKKQQKVIKEPDLFLKGTYHGNLLGRFWCSRDKKDQRANSIRGLYGLLKDYCVDEIHRLYSQLALNAHKTMRRGRSLIETQTFNEKDVEMATMNGVLLLTDWRLLFLREHVLTNALIQYMPTNLGNVFFEIMTEYLVELILDANIEFHTIIFAFGGSPHFEKLDFLKFWKKLIVHTNKTIDVHWMAQDWLDGMVCSEEDIEQLTGFNQYVEKVINSMRETGFRNYAFCNIRNQYKVPLLPDDAYKTPSNNDCLQNLYFAYVRHFVNESNCYGFSSYFNNSAPSIDNFNDNDARYPKHKTPEEL
ncbi:hypothetical protein CRE_25437 [Caenorhabditis remanei]|uniref:Uncharacterized protein n=1 Tax=Caenorhabditis remanei TaxID=31234 RepID=E3LT66_CAERE|nr:hypothetical protein CRE_25437 [Caenorhabditis remanei]